MLKLKMREIRNRCLLVIADEMSEKIRQSSLDTLSKARYTNAIERGVYLLRAGHTVQRQPGHFAVKSENSNETYTLDANEKRIGCSCHAGRKAHPCKHSAMTAIVRRYAELH
jgi:hypothetical protein